MGWDWLYNPIAIPRDLFVKPFTGGNDKGGAAPSPQALPAPPKADDAAEGAQKQVAKRRAATTQTVFTDPLGVSGQADIVRKTLTGQ